MPCSAWLRRSGYGRSARGVLRYWRRPAARRWPAASKQASGSSGPGCPAWKMRPFMRPAPSQALRFHDGGRGTARRSSGASCCGARPAWAPRCSGLVRLRSRPRIGQSVAAVLERLRAHVVRNDQPQFRTGADLRPAWICGIDRERPAMGHMDRRRSHAARCGAARIPARLDCRTLWRCDRCRDCWSWGRGRRLDRRSRCPRILSSPRNPAAVRFMAGVEMPRPRAARPAAPAAPSTTACLRSAIAAAIRRSTGVMARNRTSSLANAVALFATAHARRISAGKPSATTGVTTVGSPAATASSTLFWMPRAMCSGAAATAARQRNGRTSGTCPVTSMVESAAARAFTWRVGWEPTSLSLALGIRLQDEGPHLTGEPESPPPRSVRSS